MLTDVSNTSHLQIISGNYIDSPSYKLPEKKYLNILVFCKSTPEILSSQSFFHGKILSEIHPKGIITTTEALGQSKPRGFVQLLRVMKMHIKEGKEDSMAMVKNISSNASWMEQKRNGLKWTDMVCYL